MKFEWNLKGQKSHCFEFCFFFPKILFFVAPWHFRLVKTLWLCEAEEEEACSSTAPQQTGSPAHFYDPVMKWIYGASVGSVRKVTPVCRILECFSIPWTPPLTLHFRLAFMIDVREKNPLRCIWMSLTEIWGFMCRFYEPAGRWAGLPTHVPPHSFHSQLS